MRLALIPPIDLLDWTSRTDMQLMLPHLLDDERYEYTYRKHCDDPDQFVILDNGAAEGEQVDGKRLIELGLEYGVDEIVIPDVIADYIGTITALENFMTTYYTMDGQPFGVWPGLMFVAQGQTMAQFRTSIEYALRFPQIKTIGLPRHAPTTTGIWNVRHLLSRWFDNKEVAGVKLHLLGGDPRQPTELKNTPWPKVVRSHDTSSPFNFAYAGKKLRMGNVVRRPADYFDLDAYNFTDAELLDGQATSGTFETLEYNVRKLKEWCGIYDNASHH